jgi:uncharacterized protein
VSVTELGGLRADGDRCAVHFERLYDFTVDELWHALTDPESLRGWLGHVSRWTLARGEAYELDVGGRTIGRIAEIEPGRVLELTWRWGDEPESLLRLELEPRGDGCLLILDHRLLDREHGVDYGAGWHAHLDMLEAVLGGSEVEFTPRYRELRPAYEEQAAELGPDWLGPGGTELLDAIAAGDDGRAVEVARRRPELREQPDEEGLLPAMRALYVRGRAVADGLAPPEQGLDVFLAAALGRVERVRELLDAEPGLVRSFSPDGFTPLHLACFSGGAETVRLLADRGAPLEERARNRFAQVPPLGTAAFARDLDAARALLDAGADPDGRGGLGFTPLHTAAQNGDAELVRLLLERGADTSVAAEDGLTAADRARAAGHEEVLALLGHGSSGD